MSRQDELWDKVKNSLAKSKEISAEIYNFYIGPSKIVKLLEDEIVVEVNHNFAREIFAQNLVLIKNILAEEVGTNVGVYFLLPQEIHKAGVEFFKTKDLKKQLKNDIETTKTFSNFINGPSNLEAYLASESVASDFGIKWNPLFIYGSSGLGKTHLLTAIANEIREHNPLTKILFLEAHEFGKQVIDVIQKGHDQIEKFKHLIIENDILILDDIQMISRWDRTNRILFEIFNYFIKNNRQIIFSSDKYPDDLPGFEKRMISRFNLGLSVCITSPGFETAVAIIKLKFKNQGMLSEISDSAIEFLAHHFRDDVRGIEGAVKRVLFVSVVYPKKYQLIGLPEVQEIFSNTNFKKNDVISYDKIITIASEILNVSKDSILGRGRSRVVSHARKIVIYLIRILTNDPYKKIANFFNRDHTTIMASFKQISAKVRVDEQFRKNIEDIKLKISNV